MIYKGFYLESVILLVSKMDRNHISCTSSRWVSDRIRICNWVEHQRQSGSKSETVRFQRVLSNWMFVCATPSSVVRFGSWVSWRKISCVCRALFLHLFMSICLKLVTESQQSTHSSRRTSTHANAQPTDECSVLAKIIFNRNFFASTQWGSEYTTPPKNENENGKNVSDTSTWLSRVQRTFNGLMVCSDSANEIQLNYISLSIHFVNSVCITIQIVGNTSINAPANFSSYISQSRHMIMCGMHAVRGERMNASTFRFTFVFISMRLAVSSLITNKSCSILFSQMWIVWNDWSVLHNTLSF